MQLISCLRPRIATALLITALLSGCGQKGPLFLPGAEAEDPGAQQQAQQIENDGRSEKPRDSNAPNR